MILLPLIVLALFGFFVLSAITWLWEGVIRPQNNSIPGLAVVGFFAILCLSFPVGLLHSAMEGDTFSIVVIVVGLPLAALTAFIYRDDISNRLRPAK